jgi:hypothetical protein
MPVVDRSHSPRFRGAGRATQFQRCTAWRLGPAAASSHDINRRRRNAPRPRTAHLRASAALLQYFYEHRLIRAFEVQRCTAAAGDRGQLGHRPVRVQPDSACQPLVQRVLLGAAAQRHAGSDHARGLRRVLDLVFGSAAEVEPLSGVCVDRCRGLADFSEAMLGAQEHHANRNRESNVGAAQAATDTASTLVAACAARTCL